MSAEHGIRIQDGPRVDRTVASTVVKAENDGGYWISTIRLSGYPTKRYETLVFPVPTEVEVVADEAGQAQFTGEVVLRQTPDMPVARHNLTNMSRIDYAQRNHQRAVENAKVSLTPQVR